MTLIDIKNLGVSFDGHAVFSGLNLKIDEGDYLCILGENGSGKTTLMKCILGLSVRYSGTIDYNGLTRRQIGYLPQRAETKKDFPASVWEVVLSGFGSKSFFGIRTGTAQKKTAAENMELLEISQLKNRAFSELSGGQQQKVLLCRALCAANRVLLLDEPVTGLDTPSQNELYALVKKLNDSGMTVITISHDIKRAVTDADKILHMADNRHFSGTREEYIKTDIYKNLTEV